jgi:hypothetical protein
MVVERSRAFVSCSAERKRMHACHMRRRIHVRFCQLQRGSNGYFVRIHLCALYIYKRIFLYRYLESGKGLDVCNRRATDVQQTSGKGLDVCNRQVARVLMSATDVQQTCNRRATDVQHLATHIVEIPVYILHIYMYSSLIDTCSAAGVFLRAATAAKSATAAYTSYMIRIYPYTSHVLPTYSSLIDTCSAAGVLRSATAVKSA